MIPSRRSPVRLDYKTAMALLGPYWESDGRRIFLKQEVRGSKYPMLAHEYMIDERGEVALDLE